MCRPPRRIAPDRLCEGASGNSPATSSWEWYRVGSIPHTVVIGPDGRILNVTIGFQRGHTERIKEMARKEFRGES